MVEKIKQYKDVISGILVITFAVFMFVSTFQIYSLVGAAESIDSKAFPRLVAGVLFLLGSIVLVQGILSVWKTKKDERIVNAAKASKLSIGQGAACTIQTLILIGLYIYSMNKLGFLISTFLYLFAQMIVLSTREQRKYVLFAVISVIVSVGVYLTFTHLLYLSLPTGILG
jgi:putative tricarboxylic transport membrane protein